MVFDYSRYYNQILYPEATVATFLPLFYKYRAADQQSVEVSSSYHINIFCRSVKKIINVRNSFRSGSLSYSYTDPDQGTKYLSGSGSYSANNLGSERIRSHNAKSEVHYMDPNMKLKDISSSQLKFFETKLQNQEGSGSISKEEVGSSLPSKWSRSAALHTVPVPIRTKKDTCRQHHK